MGEGLTAPDPPGSPRVAGGGAGPPTPPRGGGGAAAREPARRRESARPEPRARGRGEGGPGRAGEERLTERLGGRVTPAGDGVQAKAILGAGIRARAIRARETVAVPEIHDDRSTLECALDRGPGRIRGVDLDDVVCPARRFAGR